MDEAIVVAGENRPRLIAMITIAATLTRLLLAFTLGKGSAFRQPLPPNHLNLNVSFVIPC